MAKGQDLQSGALKPLLTQIKAYERKFEPWSKKCKQITKAYRNESTFDSDWAKSYTYGSARFSLFWSNIKVLKAIVYSRMPGVECERRYKDKDPVARVAAEIRERVGDFQVKTSSFHHVMDQLAYDYLLCGRGQPWIRYEPKYGQPFSAKDDPDPILDAYGNNLREVVGESVVLEYVHNDDFGHNCAPVWEKVTAGWRRIHMTREEALKRFGKEKAERLKYNKEPENYSKEDLQQDPAAKQACIYEHCDKNTMLVSWFCMDYKEDFLDQQKDPFRFKNFFPFPAPIFGTLTNDSLVPVPDYVQAKEMYDELDDLMARRRETIRSIRIKAAYNGAQKELASLINMADDLAAVPVDNWPNFAQSKGISGNIDFLPIEPMIKALGVINQAIPILQAQIMEINGVSDLMRGQSVASETATAQNLKSNFTSRRQQEGPAAMERMVTDTIDMMTECAIENFDPETIYKIAAVDQMSPEAQQAFPYALELLRNDEDRTFRLSISSDSLAAADDAIEKENAVQFMKAYKDMMGMVTEMLETSPALVGSAMESVLMVLRRFKAGRQLEFAVEQDFERLKAQLQEQEQQPPQPSPEEQAAQQEMQLKGQLEEMKLQAKQQEIAMKAELEKMKADMEAMLQKYKIDKDAETAITKAQIDGQTKQQTAMLTQPVVTPNFGGV